MDAFKVLTRGTTAHRPDKRHKELQVPRIPSAGVSTHPQNVSELPLLTTSPRASKSKKRKRTTGKDDASTTLATPTAESENQENRNAEAKLGGLQGGTDSFVAASIPDEEIHRTLNQHKLKVSWMNPAIAQEDVKRTSKGGRKKAPESKKPGLVRIFPRPLLSFRELRDRYRVSRRLMDNIEAQGFSIPTEVQIGSLPILLGGIEDNGLYKATGGKITESRGLDLLTVAPTGSGKTVAFLIPLIQGILRIRHDEHGEQGVEDCVRGVILAPTHELMDQIVIEGKKLTAGTGTRIAPMQKGSQLYQESSNDLDFPQDANVIKADVIVSTPLMLLNSLQSETAVQHLPSVRHLILDEADVLLDPLFREQTLGIWSACENVDLRVSLWSATMGSSIENIVKDYIASRRSTLSQQPSYDHYLLRLVVGLKDSSLPSINHRLVYSGTEQGKLLGLRELLHPPVAVQGQLPSLRPPFLVFTQTIQRARALYSELLYDIPAEAGGSSRIAVLHSELSDHVRSDVMTRFRQGELWIIITTDLLSRGIDFRGMNGVVNFDIPTTAASYVHRAGRTGRAGREGGTAVTLYTRDDIPYVKNIANVIAATEKMHGRQEGADRPGLEKWLLEALPKVSRDAKMELKRRGVAARRTYEPGAKRSKEARRARISTKSGYDREVRNRRKGAIEKSKRRDQVAETDEWEGFDD